MTSAHPRYEVVIGLEVHTHLRTASKLFSPAPVVYGAEPNHAVHPICLALPGVLPVLNARAVELAIRMGHATHCKVHPRSVFARKNYFYPDLPKGYQISQFEEPICTGGWVDVAVDDGGETRRVGLTRIHMEEDAGKSIHDDAVTGRDATHVDLNRSGVPLLEIVSEPDMRSPAEAAAYLRTLRSILRYTDVSDGDMEKGHFRCDANVSLRPKGAKELGTRTELKNLATMHYDPASGQTRVLRLKENSDDYRYFPDPDLIPLVIPEEQIERARAELPELADEKCERFRRDHGLAENDARILAASRGLAEYFEAASKILGAPRSVANWMLRDVLRALSEQEIEIEAAKLPPESLASLIRMADEGTTTVKSARALIPELVARGGDPAALVRERGLEAVSDAGVLESAVDAVIAEHPEDAARYRAGEQKVMNFLMGQVMRRTGGKANPGAVRELIARRLAE
jgi:aspartyl-tRNA(Asn)/glutamyl-tRNA(Gln) amidotransferase subunit B